MPADLRISVKRTGMAASFSAVWLADRAVCDCTTTPYPSKAPSRAIAAYNALKLGALLIFPMFFTLPDQISFSDAKVNPALILARAHRPLNSQRRFCASKCSVGDGKRELQQLLPARHRHGFVDNEGHGRSLFKGFLDSANVQSSACAAALETVQDFLGLVEPSCLVIENAESGVTARPLRKKVNGLF